MGEQGRQPAGRVSPRAEPGTGPGGRVRGDVQQELGMLLHPVADRVAAGPVDTGAQKENGRPDRPRAQHHLAGGDRLVVVEDHAHTPPGASRSADGPARPRQFTHRGAGAYPRASAGRVPRVERRHPPPVAARLRDGRYASGERGGDPRGDRPHRRQAGAQALGRPRQPHRVAPGPALSPRLEIRRPGRRAVPPVHRAGPADRPAAGQLEGRVPERGGVACDHAGAGADVEQARERGGGGRTGLEQQDVRAGVGEPPGHHTPGGARTDHHDIGVPARAAGHRVSSGRRAAGERSVTAERQTPAP